MAKADAAKAAEVTTEDVTEEVAPEEAIDLTAFEAAVAEAVSGSDEATGEVPEIEVAKVRDAYQALPGIKAKNAAKASLNDNLKAHLADLKVREARAVMVLVERATVAGKSQAPKKEVNLQEQFESKIATLTLALYLAQKQVPEGVNAEAGIEAGTTLANDHFPAALDVISSESGESDSALIRNAVKLASTKARKGGTRVATGERRDLGSHISEAFDSVESGTFLSVADIKRFKSTVYGDDTPSAGAITNRLEPKSGKATTIEGITVEHRADKLGAVKN